MSFFSNLLGPIGGIAGGLLAAPTGGMSIGMGALLGLGAGSAVSSAFSAEDINKRQIRESDKQMAFQERMSNTAHQREVDDLRAAGLNPILSARYGGSSTPSGSMATLQNPQKDLPSNLSNSARNYLDTQMNKELIKTQQTQQRVNSALAYKEGAEALNSLERAKQSKMQTEVMRSTMIDRRVGEKYKYWLNMFNPMNMLPGVSSFERR